MLQLQSSWLLWIWPHWRQAAHSLPTDRLPHGPSRSTAVLIDNTNCGRLCWWPRCGDRFSQWEGRRSWRATRVSGNKVHVIHQRKTLKKLHNCNPPEEVFLVNTTLRLFGSTTRVTRVSLTDMCNINNPALQAERFVLLSDKSNLFYQGHTGLRSRTVRCQ